MTPPRSSIGRTSGLLYTGISLAVAVAFHAAARWIGGAPPLAVWGGTVWVLILALIVSTPLITGWVRRSSSERDNGGGSP